MIMLRSLKSGSDISKSLISRGLSKVPSDYSGSIDGPVAVISQALTNNFLTAANLNAVQHSTSANSISFLTYNFSGYIFLVYFMKSKAGLNRITSLITSYGIPGPNLPCHHSIDLLNIAGSYVYISIKA